MNGKKLGKSKGMNKKKKESIKRSAHSTLYDFEYDK